jgi:uncharacterized protein (TIGR03437 family)
MKQVTRFKMNHSILLIGCFALAGELYAQAPAITTAGTVNAADYSRSVAPGALIAIFGSNLATSPSFASTLPLPNSLGGASVELASNGEQFPLWYASGTQINAQLPFDVPTGQVQIRVRTSAGVSNVDTITVSARAPKIFTVDFTGQGSAVATNPSYQVLTSSLPAKPADTIVLWMNSMGAGSADPLSGAPAPGTTPGSQPSTIGGVTATVSGIDAPVTFAGLSPGTVGLYQVNIQAPFAVITGPVSVQVTVGGVSTQTNVTLPFRQMGFYFTLLGGKAVTGQTMNGVSGSTSALAFRQSDQVTWGTAGFNAWTDNTGLGSQYSTVSGMAVTLRNGSAVVYDNNGIESGTQGSFYDNTNGPANSQKPGLTDLYSMSNYFPLTFAGYIKLAQSTTVTELIGYFDTLGNLALPFDPQNGYIRYRMNIWSNVTGTLPKETGNFTGDVFSSDSTAGTFSFSDTGVKIISSVKTDAPKSLYRLSYKLASPLTLPAGEYWFSHDAAIRAQPVQPSSDAVTSTTGPVLPTVSSEDFEGWIRGQGEITKNPMKFFVFGRELSLENSYQIPRAVVVRPSAVVAH